MRVVFVLLVAGVAAFVSGCSGGSGSDHSGRGAYFDAIESGFACGTATPESSTPDPTESVAGAQREIDSFAALTPPPELASAHRDLVEAEQGMLDLLRQLGGATPSVGDAYTVDKARALATAEANWLEAFASHYGTILFRNEGASMEPAFHSDEILGFTPYAGEALSRWQIVVFRFPLDQSRWFFKRIVGLPGETVEIHDEVIDINGTPVQGDVYAKAAPNYTYGPITVPADSYFVLGDNRRNSYDSHAWTGIGCATTQTCAFVPKDDILGVLPASGAEPLTKWWCPSPEPATSSP